MLNIFITSLLELWLITTVLILLVYVVLPRTRQIGQWAQIQDINNLLKKRLIKWVKAFICKLIFIKNWLTERKLNKNNNIVKQSSLNLKTIMYLTVILLITTINPGLVAHAQEYQIDFDIPGLINNPEYWQGCLFYTKYIDQDLLFGLRAIQNLEEQIVVLDNTDFPFYWFVGLNGQHSCATLRIYTELDMTSENLVFIRNVLRQIWQVSPYAGFPYLTNHAQGVTILDNIQTYLFNELNVWIGAAI